MFFNGNRFYDLYHRSYQYCSAWFVDRYFGQVILQQELFHLKGEGKTFFQGVGGQDPQKVISFDHFVQENKKYNFLHFTQSWGRGQAGAKYFTGGLSPPKLSLIHVHKYAHSA